MVSPPFHLSSVVSDPSLLFNLMAHTRVHTYAHTRGEHRVRQRERQWERGGIGGFGHTGRGGAALGAMRHRGEAASETASEARRHRVWHRGQGGIGAWRHRGLRRDSGARERSGAALVARRHRGFGGIGGGIGGEAASWAASTARRHRELRLLRRHRAKERVLACSYGGKGRTCAMRGDATTIYLGAPAWCSSSC